MSTRSNGIPVFRLAVACSTEEAGLAKPMVKRRVPELAEAIIATLPKVEIADPFARNLDSSRCGFPAVT